MSETAMPISRWVTYGVERCAELGVAVSPPHRQVVAAAVLDLRGRAVDAVLEPLYEWGGELGSLLTRRATEALGVAPADIQSYGKAALVGMDLPLEWAAALLHPRLGRVVRTYLPAATTIMPSVARRGAPGTCVDIPLHGVSDMWSFDHFDTVSLSVADAPASHDILVAIALADRGRPLARVKPDE
jgi:hypothetical protein